MKRLLASLALLLTVLPAAGSFAADSSAILPKVFAGWTLTSSHASNDPATADPTQAALLKEDGFTNFEKAEYSRPGRKITVEAVRFSDASGAFSAFTTYKTPEMQPLDMGSKTDSLGASLPDRVIFYRQNILVQAKLDQVTPMTAGEMRELASMLPPAPGGAKDLPSLPGYLPKQSYVRDSARYVMGPVGLAQIGSPLPPQTVGFNQGAEVVTGNYSTSRGTATLIVISYPTPAIAGEHLRAIEALNQNFPPASSPEVAPPFTAKRSGPLVAVTAGQISPEDAKSLLASVSYDADVTWNENTHFDKNDNMFNLLGNIVILIAIILGLCLVAGVAFGGLRILLRRLYPGKLFGREDDVEFIELKIRK
jgi:Family of unknown function (DUF6599)